jgi:DNA-binding response OmpR family regulator
MTATRLIRGLATAAARVPVIGISGHTEVNQEAVARAAGMNAYLVKPVSPAALAALLNEINRSARRVGKGALRNALNMMTF